MRGCMIIYELVYVSYIIYDSRTIKNRLVTSYIDSSFLRGVLKKG